MVEGTEAQSTEDADIWVMRFVVKKYPELRAYPSKVHMVWKEGQVEDPANTHGLWTDGRKGPCQGASEVQKSWEQGYIEMQGEPKLREFGPKKKGMCSRCQRPEATGTSKIRTERHPVCAGSGVAFAGQVLRAGRGHNRLGAARLGKGVLRGMRRPARH